MTDDSPPPFEPSDNSAPPGYQGGGPSRSVSTRPLREVISTLNTSKGKPWALLKVMSRVGKASEVPAFVEGEPITGTVELNLDKSDHIQAVTIEVQGDWTAVGQDPVPFLSQETTLWSTSMGNPSTPKLKGGYVWPFSITLPEKVDVAEIPNGPLAEYPLPPNFSERAAPSYLEYKIIVKFRRGKLRIDHVLFTSFAYQPRMRPAPASELRQLSYKENMTPPGPDVDIHGWEKIGSKSVLGTVFESRQVEVAFILYLAKPLSYSKGTIIPFHIRIGCMDQQALDLVSSKGSLNMTLVRTVYIQSTATAGEAIKPGASRTNKIFEKSAGEGVCWTADDNDPKSKTRKLDGEVPVRVDLKPSFIFPNMSVKYNLILSLVAPGFTLAPEDSHPANAELFSQEIQIVPLLPVGPTPVSRIPPELLKKDGGNYDISIGMLTGANQRFIHYHHHAS